jgi:hypothetical protein
VGCSEFVAFPKIPRLSRECTITEKIDGTNGQIFINAEYQVFAGSRNKWVLGPDGLIGPDNYGFGKWVLDHKDELIAGLGIGTHFGEWWGQGIARRYGLNERRFSLFNTSIWADDTVRPKCCHVVPVLFLGAFDTLMADNMLHDLKVNGSKASPGFMKPEGIIIYHMAASQYFKKTVENDEAPKSTL